ncbi:MAG: hypothetical protein AB7Q29_11665 [Vicinamibacterales bacterium]
MTQPEQLWQVRARQSWWTCELHFISESWGWMVWIYRDGSKFGGHRTLLRADAEEWAAEIRRDVIEGEGREGL